MISSKSFLRSSRIESFLFQMSALSIVLMMTLVDASSLAATTDMVWSDEFTTASIQRTTWNVATSDRSIPASGIQSFSSDNVAITDRDYLTITTEESSSGYTSGQIDTYNKVHFQYCTVVARIKVPDTTAGLVPTFYTQGVRNTVKNMAWPSNGEIDIMKVGQGNATATGKGNERTVSGIHYLNGDGNYYSNTGSRDCGADLSSNYYIYTLDWTPTTITTFYNDRQVWSTDIGDCKDDGDCDEFHQPHYMILHTSVGGSFPSAECKKLGASSASGGTIPNTCSTNDQLSAQDISATVPASMSVDWVRIYDNGNCQLTVIENEGGTTLPNTPVASPVTTDTGSSNEVPIGSGSGGSAFSPAGSNSGNTPGLSPTGSNTAPGGGSSPVGTGSGTQQTFPPNLTPIGSDTGSSGGSPTGSGSGSSGGSPTGSGSGSSGGSPTGSGSGGSGGLSPTGSGSGGSGGLSPTGSVSGPAGSAPVIPIPPVPVTVPVPTPIRSIPIPPAPAAVPVTPPVEPPVMSPVVPPVTPPPVQPPATPPVEPPTVSVVQPPATPPVEPPTVSVVQPPATPPAEPPSVSVVQPPAPPPIGPPTVSVVQPPVVSSNKDSKGKKKCTDKKAPGVISGDGSSGKGDGKGEGKGGSSGSGVTGDGSSSSSGGKGGDGKGGSSESGVTGDQNSNTNYDNGDTAEGKAGYRYHQRQRRRKEQVTTPNSVGGGNTVNSNNTNVVSGVGGADDEECEEFDADALSVESSSPRHSTPLLLLLLLATMIGCFIQYM